MRCGPRHARQPFKRHIIIKSSLPAALSLPAWRKVGIFSRRVLCFIFLAPFSPLPAISQPKKNAPPKTHGGAKRF